MNMRHAELGWCPRACSGIQHIVKLDLGYTFPCTSLANRRLSPRESVLGGHAQARACTTGMLCCAGHGCSCSAVGLVGDDWNPIVTGDTTTTSVEPFFKSFAERSKLLTRLHWLRPS